MKSPPTRECPSLIFEVECIARPKSLLILFFLRGGLSLSEIMVSFIGIKPFLDETFCPNLRSMTYISLLNVSYISLLPYCVTGITRIIIAVTDVNNS